MAAVAFTGTAIFKGQRTGRILHIRTAMSDVAAQSWTFSDGSAVLQLPSDDNYSLVDMIVVVGGTDTNQSALWVNQTNSGLVIDHKSNLNTSQFRQFITNPVGFKAGSQLRFIQAA